MYKSLRCDVCKEKHRRNWNKTERGKEYHKIYMRSYNKEK